MRDVEERERGGVYISCDDSMLDIASSSLYPSIASPVSFSSVRVVCKKREKKKKKKKKSLRVLCLILSPSYLWPRRLGVGQSFDFPVDRPLLLSNRL